MAGFTVDVGTGITVVATTSSWTAELLSVDWSGITRPGLETTHMATAAAGAGKFGNATYIPGDISQPGTLSLTHHLNPDTTVPIDLVAETWTLTWPKAAGDATAATWAASGFATDYSTSAAIDEVMEATLVIQLTGNVTITPAAT